MGCRRMYLLWDRSLISRFFTYKYVHAWRTVYAVFYMAGTADRMAGCSAKTDYTLYDLVSMEFITGIIVNKWYHLAVWDYSDMPLQLWGQICLPFALIFSFLCTMGILLSGYLLHWFYREPIPHYRIW